MTPQVTPSTSDTSESFIADDSPRHMKLIGGMLANWGGSTYRGDLLPDNLTPEKYILDFQKVLDF